MLKKIKIRQIIILLILLSILLVGCTKTTEKNEEFEYNDNNPYNTHSVSDDDNIYLYSENKIYAINKMSHQYSVIMQADYGLFDIAFYNDWIYCIEGLGQLDNSKIFKISKDGKQNIELLADTLYLNCWIYDGTFYILSTNNSLVEAFSLDKEGDIKDKLKEGNEFLFKDFNYRQNKIIQENKAQNENVSEKDIKFIALEAYDEQLLNLEGYNRLYYKITISKENPDEAGYTWIIKNSDTDEIIASLDVMNDKIIIMNGEIAYVDKGGESLKCIDFKGNEKDVIKSESLSGFLNYDKDWIYYYTNTYITENVCSRTNRNTGETENLFEGISTEEISFNNFFEVYEGLLIYTEYQSGSNDTKIVIYDTETGEKKYIE